jgi:hypothetical protein
VAQGTENASLRTDVESVGSAAGGVGVASRHWRRRSPLSPNNGLIGCEYDCMFFIRKYWVCSASD